MAEEKTSSEKSELMVTVTVTWGGHKLTPVQYNSVDIGQLVATATVPYGKVPAAIAAMHTMLKAEGDKLFEEKIHEHADFIRRASHAMKAANRG